MNPILHELHNKQWIWTAAKAKQANANTNSLNTGFEELNKALNGGFPKAGMIHVSSILGCGELRLMLKMMNNASKQNSDSQHISAQADKLWVFIAPPFMLNAEFLLSESLSLEQLIVISPSTQEEALWSAEQCSKSGACTAVFLWQQGLAHSQIRKLELAAQQGACHCFWFDNRAQATSNLPLSLSLSLQREHDDLSVTINKQKLGWAKPAVSVKVPFRCRTSTGFSTRKLARNNVVHIHANP